MEFDVKAHQDDSLKHLLDSVSKAVIMFSEAIRNSEDQHVCISFKAFTLKAATEEEKKTIFETSMSAVAIELHKHAKDLLKIYTFYHSIETEEKESSLFLHCRKVLPPTSEEILAMNAEPAVECKEILCTDYVETKNVLDKCDQSPCTN